MFLIIILFINITAFVTSTAFCKNSKKNIQDLGNVEEPPTIMVTYSWSFGNIGDIGITPGLFNLLQKYIPEAEVILVTSSSFEKYKSYIGEHYPDVKVIDSPFGNNGHEISRRVFKSIQEPPKAAPFRGIPEEEAARKFQEAFAQADMVLFNSGTTLSFGRYGHGWDNTRTMDFAVPLFMAREAGKPYGIYGQSFERFAWPSNKLFVPLLSDAEFVFARDGNSLKYLRSLGVSPPILEFGPDATFAFNIFSEETGDTFMEDKNLKNHKFITITIRSSVQGFVDNEREQAHAAKLRELIKRYVDRTGNDVLIAPEVIHEIEPAKRLLLEPLPEKTRQHVVFKNKFWEPGEAQTVYSRAEAIVSMEMHSIIMGLGVGTPVLHPRFLEAGRKAWMLKDLGLEEWLFDIDEVPVDAMFNELMEIHDNYDAALGKVESAMDFVHERQKETMAVVRNTLKDAARQAKK